MSKSYESGALLRPDLAKFSAFVGFSPFFYACPPIDDETLCARALRAPARAWTSQIDPGRDGELARQVSHDVAAWCAKPRHRAPGERGGAHAIKFDRARRRTKLEAHGDARTRPVGERLRKRKETPSRTVLGPLFSPSKAPSARARATDGN